MDAQEFVRILGTFTESRQDIDLSKGRLLVELVGGDLIDATVRIRDGILHVTEGTTETPGPRWIIRRVAKLDLLADRILRYIEPVPNFIQPAGSLLDTLEQDPSEVEVVHRDSLACVTAVLDRQPADTCSILYLTSDAGEGKTSLINQLARERASAYKRDKSGWLLVPIALGGRTFLRFDEVVAAAILNRFRFTHLFYDAFVELVRMGAIVPALDGFEEMFVENTSGDAVSALGNLVQSFNHGSVLIAARKAYFEYRSLDTQARLFDALGDARVSFAKFALRRWDREHFLSYARERRVPDPDAVYNDVCTSLGDDHPVLTRAVLVRRLLEVTTIAEQRTQFISRLAGAKNEFFAEFVRTIIEREVHEKWIDRAGTLAKPLLSVEQHFDLLARVALEMWTGKTASLRADVLDLIAELFCDQQVLDSSTSRQVIERLKQHALLAKDSSSPDRFAFDHEEFNHYFLGESVATAVATRNGAEVRNILSRASCPVLVLDVAAHKLISAQGTSELPAIAASTNEACSLDSRASFSRENAGGLLIRLASSVGAVTTTIRELVFPSNALQARSFHGLEVASSHFQPTSLRGSIFHGCHFRECVFDRIELPDDFDGTGVVLENCTVGCVVFEDSEQTFFEPSAIFRSLAPSGFTVSTGQKEKEPLSVSPPEMDHDVAITQRALRAFQRATEVNELSLRQRLGQKQGDFFDRVLPALLAYGVLREVPYRGSGHQRRYKLCVRMSDIHAGLRRANGSLDDLLALLNKKSAPPPA